LGTSRGIFVTGTDTGVGKTLITAGILRWLRHHGINAAPMKPVQTGGEARDGRLIAPDLEFCLAASGIQASQDDIKLMAPYVYEPACSPHLAGRMAQHYPELSRIKDCAGKLLQNYQVVVVEGAGGVMVPLNESFTMLDLMKELDYPVVLVSRFGLGTINHTLLSIHTMQTSGLKLIGIVFNHTERPQAEDRFIEEDNPVTIAQFSGARVLGQIGYLENLNPEKEETWQHFEKGMTGLENILLEV